MFGPSIKRKLPRDSKVTLESSEAFYSRQGCTLDYRSSGKRVLIGCRIFAYISDYIGVLSWSSFSKLGAAACCLGTHCTFLWSMPCMASVQRKWHACNWVGFTWLNTRMWTGNGAGVLASSASRPVYLSKLAHSCTEAKLRKSAAEFAA